MMGGTYDMMGGVAYGSMGETAPEVLGVPVPPPTSASAPRVAPYQKIFDHSPPGAVQQLHMGIGEARKAVRARDFNRALKILKDIMEAYPGSKQARLAEVEYQHIKDLMHNSEISGDASKALAVARAALRDRKYQVALGLLDNIANIYPNTPEGRYSRNLIGKISQGLASGKLVEGSVLIERRDARYKAKEQYVKARSENVAIADARGKAVHAAKLAIKGKRYQVALTLLENIANTYPNTHEEKFARHEIQRILRGLANRTLIEGAR